MSLGVVDAADVLVDRHPVIDEPRVERRLMVVRIAVAEEVPGGVDERIHRLAPAPAGPAAFGAGDATSTPCSEASGGTPFG